MKKRSRQPALKPDKFLGGLFGLKDRVAVVIGGTGELCGAIAESLASAGAEVVLVGRDEGKAAVRLQRIESLGGKAWFHPAEATRRKELDGLLAAVLARSGHVDVLINGAGINSPTPFLEIAEAEVDRILAVNFKSVFLACQVFGRHMIEAGRGGSIINIGSVSALTPLSRVFSYSASKAAVHNITRNLAREWAPLGIRVNTLVPGFFPAEQNRAVLSQERIAKIIGHTPAGRFGAARELAGAALLLASEEAGSFISGSELVVDGGFGSVAI